MPEILKQDDQPDTSSSDSFLLLVKQHVIELFNDEHDNRILYHNFQRTAEIVAACERIASASNTDQETNELIQISAWFHAIGYLFDYSNASEASLRTARVFLEERQYPPARLSRVLACIRSVNGKQQPESPESQILSDAINSVNHTTRFFQQRPLLRLEEELINNKRLSNMEWEQLQMQQLLATRFYTGFGKSEFEPIVGQNILIQKDKTEKSRINQLRQPMLSEDGGMRKFQQLERKLPTSAIQTFFRTNYRNHINLSAIADNKANIMISVNAILISVIISVLSYRNLSETTPMILLPVVIFLMTGLTSLIFAVLSIRPKVTSLNEGSTTLEAIKKNVIYFGNFVNLDLEQYEEAMDAIFRDGELLYGNMTRDLYFLGKVLDKKYRYLTLSYNIFMVGFVATVVLFLIAMFL